MGPLRRTLVALLAAATMLFAVGVTAERSAGEDHAEPATVQTGESGEEDERVLGVDVESTPLIVLAVVAGLGLAAAAATGLGRRRGFLVAVALIALGWAALDVRQVFHQLDEANTGIAVVAMVVAALHLAAAAVGGRLAQQGRTASSG